MAFLNLPNELVVKIVSNITHRDLIACQLSNKLLYAIIKDSVLLQFQVALSTFKATDNPSCPFYVAERLQALKDSENAWSCLRKDFERRITVNDEMSRIHGLTAGVLIFGNVARTALHYTRLTSSVEDLFEWRKIQLDHNEGRMLGVGLCLYEHDLVVVVTSKPRYSGLQITTYDIKLVLLKLSTGKPHPAARESTILVLNSEWDRPGVAVEIVGDRLVLILSCTNNELMPRDRVFVYDWCNAVREMSFTAHCRSYSGLVFLSENLVVIPNSRTNALEIWDISSTSQTPRPAGILQLPELSLGDTLVYIVCRGEPNPISSQSQPQSHTPFYQSAHEAIIMFRIRAQLMNRVDGSVCVHMYTLLVHRKALCDVYERHYAHMNNKDEMMVDDDGSGGWESIGSDNEDDIPVRTTDNDPVPIPGVLLSLVCSLQTTTPFDG